MEMRCKVILAVVFLSQNLFCDSYLERIEKNLAQFPELYSLFYRVETVINEGEFVMIKNTKNYKHGSEMVTIIENSINKMGFDDKIVITYKNNLVPKYHISIVFSEKAKDLHFAFYDNGNKILTEINLFGPREIVVKKISSGEVLMKTELIIPKQ